MHILAWDILNLSEYWIVIVSEKVTVGWIKASQVVTYVAAVDAKKLSTIFRRIGLNTNEELCYHDM